MLVRRLHRSRHRGKAALPQLPRHLGLGRVLSAALVGQVVLPQTPGQVPELTARSDSSRNAAADVFRRTRAIQFGHALIGPRGQRSRCLFLALRH